MTTIAINGANIYYETLGEDKPGQIPILLVHGSTSTGQDDWGTVAPILARKRRVIVPDCRGHGRSDNPNGTYSFSEMAADMAMLVRALGYERAHVIGHSNGGNVALLTLMEHPEVVQTAVLQAANGYVDDYLRDREPGIFVPERIQREAPAWWASMMRLHAPFHGEEYVRKLLALTLVELLAGPNYTPEDLSVVDRPTLVVQGAEDQVNAPSRHGQYIAKHIPQAELWTPKGVKHNVHDEVTAEWLQRIESFLERRGDPVNEGLHRLGSEAYADGRQWVYTVRADANLRLSGQVLYTEQLHAATDRAAQAAGKPVEAVDASGVRVLITAETPWALANRPVSDVRIKAGILNERVSQLLLGEAVRILEDQGEWVWVRLERDGYLGWTHAAGLLVTSEAEARAYRPRATHRVHAELQPMWAVRDEAGEVTLSSGKLPFGTRVAVTGQDGEWAEICLPDGMRRWTAADGLLPEERLPKPDAEGIAETLRLVRRFVGAPYQWGGRTPFGYDCSGLAGAFWEWLGVILPRDANQQFGQGRPVEGEPQPGDLLFFGEPDPDHNKDREHHITHVGISLGGERILHSTAAYWGTVYNSLDPDSPEYRAWLRENLVGVRRYT